MKKTAVEWLRQELLKRDMDISIKDLFEQAKEMEKQQGYSEEDMIAFGEFIFKNTLLVNVKGVEGILEQFKNK